MDRRRLAYIGVALAVLVAGRLIRSPSIGSDAHLASSGAPEDGAKKSAPMPELETPADTVVEFGILTERSEQAAAGAIERESIAGMVGPELCGDPATCRAVRRTIRDERATTLRVTTASEWNAGRPGGGAELDAGTRALRKQATVAIVRVAMATSQEELPLRTAWAAAAVIAAKTEGSVDDALLGRVESAEAFAKRALTAPLGLPVFRADLVQILFEPKGEGVVRMLTTGLERFGAPDVEAAAVPVAASGAMGHVLLAVAESIANGARRSPVAVSLVSAATTPGGVAEGGSPVLAPRPSIGITSVHPEAGDPNDFMARIQPPDGDGPLGFLQLAEQFFGPVLTSAPDEATQNAARDRSRRALGPALSEWARTRGAERKLLVRLPFAIPGDAGVESMWITVTAYDERSVTGILADDPIAATDVARGDRIKRPRTDVEDLVW